MERRPLSRERILDAALELVDAEGLEALSMRNLGQRLGVEAMSLYKHVPNKAALLDGIHERILSELKFPSRGGGWKRTMGSLARELRRLLAAHPLAMPLFATRPVRGAGALALIDRALGILLDAGFTEKRAAQALDAISTFTIGHALASFSDEGAEPTPLAPEGLPHVARVLGAGPIDPEAGFEFGLRALLDGLEARLAG